MQGEAVRRLAQTFVHLATVAMPWNDAPGRLSPFLWSTFQVACAHSRSGWC